MTAIHRAPLALLLAALILGPVLTRTATAQSAPPPPTDYQLDSNGVDLVTGEIQYLKEPDLSIGPAGPQGLTYSIMSRLEFTDNWNGGWYGNGPETVVVIGKQTDRLKNGVSTQGTDARLAQSVAPAPANLPSYVTRGGVQYIFDPTIQTYSNGALSAIYYPSGEIIKLEYQKATSMGIWRLKYVTNNSGYALRFEYASDAAPTINTAFDWGTITKVTAINTAQCGLTEACAQSSSWPSVTYSMSGFAEVGDARCPIACVRTITDAQSRVWRYTYDQFNRLYAVQTPGQPRNTTVITRYDNDHVHTVSNERGTTTYSYSGDQQSQEGTTTVQDASGAQFSVVSKYVGSQQPPDPPKIIRTVDALNFTTYYAYDDALRLHRVVSPEGNYVEYTYDSRGNITLTRQVSKSPSTDPDLITTANYDTTCTNLVTCNEPNWIVDWRGARTDYTYDPNHGGVLTVSPQVPAPRAVRAQTRYGYTYLQAHYKDTSGALIAGPAIPKLTTTSWCRTTASCTNTVDEIRTTISYGTDNLLPATTTTAGGNGALPTTITTTYDSIGNPTAVDGPLSGTADTTRTRYNAARQIVGTIAPDPDGNGPRLPSATRYTYDAFGTLVTLEYGTVPSQSDADWTNFTPLESVTVDHDLYGRKVRRTTTIGGTATSMQQFSYDSMGRLDCTAVRMNPAVFSTIRATPCTLGSEGTAGPDRISKIHYDTAGRQSSVTMGLGSPSQIEDSITTYTPNGMLSTLTDANGNRTTYEYDGFDRQAKLRYPSPSTPGVSSTTDFEQFSYDGNSTTVRARNGVATVFYVDGMERMSYKDLPGTAQDVSYGYDLQGRVLSETFAQLAGSPRMSITYDAIGRLDTQTTLGRTVSYQYDAAGHRTRTTYPDGFYVSYEYNSASQLTRVSDSTGVTIASYTYDDLGRRTGMSRASSASTDYEYTAGQLSRLTQNLSGTAYDSSVTYTYTPSLQIKTRTQTNDATYSWIPLAAGSSNSTFNGLNQTSQMDSTLVNYDPLGNLTTGAAATDVDWTYGFDSEGRLRSATAGSHTVSVEYDPDGNLSKISSDGVSDVTEFLFDDSQLIAEYDGNTGAVRKRYVNGLEADEPLAYYDGASYSDANRGYYFADERGSITAVSDANGVGQVSLKYSSYGASSTLGDSRFGYTGQVWIASLGLYYYKARFYSPRSGRFIQPDLIHSGDGLNRYAYADNDPINGKDPTGDDCEDGASGPCDTVVVSDSPPSPEGPVLPEITPLVIPPVVVSTQSPEVCQSIGYMLCLRTTPEMGSVLADQQGEYAALGTSLIGGEFTVETLFARVARLVKLGKIAKTSARAKTVINKNVAKLQSPPVPTGWTQGKFGSQLVRWGQGPEGAAARLRSLTPEDVARMQADGLTREIAQQWRDFYANDLLRNASNVTAGPRIELLDAIIKLMN